MTYKEAALKLCGGFLNNPSGCDGCPLATENCDDDGNAICELNDVNDAPVVRHGRWEWADDGYCRCSECRQRAPVVYGVLVEDWQDEPRTVMTYYCPNCGAKMDLEGENE